MPTCSCPRARESRSVYGPFGAHVRAPRSIRIPSPLSARSSPCHRRDKACPLTARTESARIGFDAAFRVHLSMSACRRHRNNVRSRVIARRSSRRVEHWGREFLLCIAIAPASPRGDVFTISPSAERNFWSRTRARSYEQELIAQPSSTTSRTRRGSFLIPWLSTPCGMNSSVPKTSPSVRARSRAQVAGHLSMLSPLHASSCTRSCPKPRKLARSPLG